MSEKQKVLVVLYVDELYLKDYIASKLHKEQIDNALVLVCEDRFTMQNSPVCGLRYLFSYNDCSYLVDFRADPKTFERRKEFYRKMAHTLKPVSLD